MENYSDEYESVRKKKEFNPMILVLIALILAVLVVGSVWVYQTWFDGSGEGFSISEKEEKIQKETKKATEKDKSEDKKKKNKVTEVSVNQKFIVDNMFEVTLTGYEWCEEIFPSDTAYAYSYFKDITGEKYLAVKAKVKNIAGQEINLSTNTLCRLLVNNKYTIVGNASVENSEHTDFDDHIKSLQESEAVFFFSVTDEMYNTFSEADITLSFVNNEDALNGEYSEDEYDSFSLSFSLDK